MRSVTADAITAKLVSFLEVNDLELQKVAGFGSDGASVMVGCRNGVATQLKRESLADPILKPKRALTTRWLSHDQACSTMRQKMSSVLISLERQAAEKQDPKAIGLLKLASQWKFVATLHTMCDILPKLSELSRRFQKKDLAYTDIQEKLVDTIEQLETALLVPGKFTRQRDGVIDRMSAAGINLKNPVDRDGFKLNVHDAFINAIITNLKERFPQAELLDSFRIFHTGRSNDAEAPLPRSLQEAEEISYGETEFEVILKHYGAGLSLSREETLMEWVSLSAATLCSIPRGMGICQMPSRSLGNQKFIQTYLKWQ
ncbi:putative zinc finger protein [Apostichopus japonicus]|uniref:Putative zinc finger protein n=1 Tax=Stichopus japonicus TaxID=307972 RepID=A0A2G8K1Y2_STIJA|nr:putative zinc finger protein [Apostichopus japonicus]